MLLSHGSQESGADSLLSRPRLLDLIQNPTVAPVTLITAPAGYGKTTLAGQWTNQAPHDLAWVSLGPECNHPDVFLNRLVAALPEQEKPDGQTTGEKPTVEEILFRLGRRSAMGRPLTIVLDDLHEIESQDVLQAIDALLMARLPTIYWLILSRTTPPLTLARLRLEGHVREIGPDDLSFTRAEVVRVVSLLFPGRLSDAEMETLADRTTGWIAGIRLAISALDRDTHDQQHMIASWESNSWLDDYVMEEVLASLPDELRSFILRTVRLPYLDTALCNYVLGTTTSAGLIQEVRKRLVFVRPYGTDGTGLAYHALFAESVQRIASRIMPDEDEKGIHLRASMWLEEAGMLEEAAEQAILAGAWGRAEHIIRTICRPLIDSDHIHSAWYWLRKLPQENLLNDPELARWYISTLHHLGHHQTAGDAYARVRPIWQESGNPVYLTYDLLSQTLSLAMNGHSELAVQKAYEAVSIAPDDLTIDLMHAWTYIYQIEAFRGHDDKAEHAFREAERHNRFLPADQWYWFNNTESHRISTEAIRGRLHAAEQMYTHKLENLPQTQFHHDGKLRYRRSSIWLEWNEPERIATELDDLRHQALTPPYRIWHPEVLMYAGRVEGVLGNLDGMESTLRQVREMFQERGGHHNLNRLEALEVELWLMTGRLPLAQDWTRRKSQETYAPPLLFGDPDPRMARVKTSIASDEPERAIRDLAPMIDDAANRRRWAEIVSLASWQMAALVMKGDHTEALNALRLALRHGEPGGFVRSFITPGIDLTPFLQESWPLLDVDEAAYLTKLIQQGVWTISRDATLPMNSALDDPLSSRELEVLNLMTPGLSNREIGERLFISERTVKKHVGSILRKLDTANRHAAVERARQLGLMADPSA